MKEWREDHPEYNKKWREANPDYNKEYCRKYYEVNPEYWKKWYGANRNKILESYTCCCGSTLQKCNKIRHEKTQKHKDYCTSVASPCSIVI